MDRVEKMLIAVRDVLLPLTRNEVAKGNHVFGGIILEKGSMDVVVAGSNRRVDNPLYHGEIETLNRFFAMPGRPEAKDLVFVASHDPCPMCASAIAWAGFTELWVLFDYKDVQDSFGMPVDLIMYKELFGCPGTKTENPFFAKHYVQEAVERDEHRTGLRDILAAIRDGYAALRVHDFLYPAMPHCH